MCVCVCVCVCVSGCMTEGDGRMKYVLELLSGLKKIVSFHVPGFEINVTIH